MPSLSVIIPVYNEPQWIGTVVRDLVFAVEQAPFSPVDLTIVDDGSDHATQDALAALTTPFPLNVIRQTNAGRFAARKAGVEAVAGDLVLLLDSRVSIRTDALAFVARELERTGPLPIWTAHVDPDLRGNPYGRIWWVLESLAWSDYLANPRTMSYGLSDYDRYPKGATCWRGVSCGCSRRSGAPGPSGACGSLTVEQELRQGVRQGGHAAQGYPRVGVPIDLVEDRQPVGDHRQPRGHGLGDGNSPALLVAGSEERARRP